MSCFRVALLQMTAAGSQEANLEKGVQWCRRARAMGADLALFPEMWSCGYAFPQDPDLLRQTAVSRDGPFLRIFRELARELNMAVAVTYLEQYEPSPRNTVTIFDRLGREALTYAKVHTCDFGGERCLTAGDGFHTAQLDTAEGPVRVGAMICYDREFPESARLLMLQGAEILLVPNACPMEINRLSQLRARAFENMVGVATANYAFGQPDCNGHSSAFDGIAYDDSHPASRDTLLVEAGEGEGIYLASFPMDALRAYRQREVHGNAYRRPEVYGLLTEERIQPPFLRPDRRKQRQGREGE